MSSALSAARVKWFFICAKRGKRALSASRRWGLRVQGGWRLERYNCPRFTAPDEQGRVVLDRAVDWKRQRENEGDAPERRTAD